MEDVGHRVTFFHPDTLMIHHQKQSGGIFHAPFPRHCPLSLCPTCHPPSEIYPLSDDGVYLQVIILIGKTDLR